ncbi:MAG TPA: pyridoxamine 5'-phosphate oxidase [Micromonosporaceae bacterium]
MSSTPWCSWADFTVASPRLAAAIRALLLQYGQGFGYLATVRRDGGPRVHPVSPLVAHDGLFCFVLASPKRADLDRDGRYALHAYPAEHSDDEAYLAGRVRPVTDLRKVSEVARTFRARWDLDWRLYELGIEVAMVTHRQRLKQSTQHRVWRLARGVAPGRPDGGGVGTVTAPPGVAGPSLP